MKKKDLEIRLQSLDVFVDPDPSLEQYPTPASIASDVLYTAYAEGDISGCTVNDLGCGTGILSIGAALLGGDVAGFDISQNAVDIAKKNSEMMGVDAEYLVCDVSSVERPADTTIMNPPFGSQKRNADRPFLNKAMELSRSVYSVHMFSTLPFIRKYAAERGKEVCSCKRYKYFIPHTFSFHNKSKYNIDIVMVHIR